MTGLDNIPDEALEEGRQRVYIAGPYTIGKTEVHIRNVVEAGQRVLESGHYPFLPHTHTFQWSLFYDENNWIDMDLVWLETCDSLIRLPGESEGADTEVEFANKRGIDVYYSVDEFLEEVVNGS